MEVQDFAKEVLERSEAVPVVVDFWAEWCAPCRALGPVLEELAEQAGGRWVLAKVNTDQHQDVAAQYGIRSIPNVKLFVHGGVTNEFSGALPEPAVRTWLERSLPDPQKKEIEKAEGLLKAGAVTEAQRLLDKVLKEDPLNHHARVLLAGSFVASAPAKAGELVEGIEEDSPHFQVAEAIRTIARAAKKLQHPEQLPEASVKAVYLEALAALARREYEVALERFIDVIRQDRFYDEDGARKGCIAVFKILGDDSEIAQRYRRPFSSALYA